MITFIIWAIGVALAIKAIIEIWQTNLTTPIKALLTLVMILTSWVGVVVYYLIAKDNLENWFGK